MYIHIYIYMYMYIHMYIYRTRLALKSQFMADRERLVTCLKTLMAISHADAAVSQCSTSPDTLAACSVQLLIQEQLLR